MLSYQHAYHAGNPADVLKHAVLTVLLARLTEKPTPLTYLETHAGRGIYPVAAPEMQKLREYQGGLLRLLPQKDALPRVLAPYLNLLPEEEGGLTHIPGSPAVAQALMPAGTRPQDAMQLCELHPGEVVHLRQFAKSDQRLRIHKADGHATIPGLMPANSGRALVLIDPSYEVKEEYGDTSATVAAILKANPKACVLVWYPMLAAGRHARLASNLEALSLPATWRAEVQWQAAENTQGHTAGMYGTGLIIMNLPFGVEDQLNDVLEAVTPLLGHHPEHLSLRSAFVHPPA